MSPAAEKLTKKMDGCVPARLMWPELNEIVTGASRAIYASSRGGKPRYRVMCVMCTGKLQWGRVR